MVSAAFLSPLKPLGHSGHGAFYFPQTTEKEKIMIWIILIVAGALLIKLGAFSVLVAVLTLGIKLALFLIVILSALILWQHFRYRC